MVSTSTNSTSTNFSNIVLKFALVEIVISKIVLVEFIALEFSKAMKSSPLLGPFGDSDKDFLFKSILAVV